MLSLTAAHIMSYGNVKNDYDIDVKSHKDNYVTDNQSTNHQL